MGHSVFARDELLNREIFTTLTEAKILIELDFTYERDMETRGLAMAAPPLSHTFEAKMFSHSLFTPAIPLLSPNS